MGMFYHESYDVTFSGPHPYFGTVVFTRSMKHTRERYTRSRFQVDDDNDDDLVSKISII